MSIKHTFNARQIYEDKKDGDISLAFINLSTAMPGWDKTSIDTDQTPPKAIFSYGLCPREQLRESLYLTPMAPACAYEIIHDDSKLNPYFDIDKIEVENIPRLVEYIKHTYKKIYNVEFTNDDFYIAIRRQSTMHVPKLIPRDYKPQVPYYSAHIIVNDGKHYHESNSEIETIVKYMNKNIDIYYKNEPKHMYPAKFTFAMFDECVYGITQLMRLPVKMKSVIDDNTKLLYPFKYQTLLQRIRKYTNVIDKNHEDNHIKMLENDPYRLGRDVREFSSNQSLFKKFIITWVDDSTESFKYNGKMKDIDLIEMNGYRISNEFFKYIQNILMDVRIEEKYAQRETSTLVRMLQRFENSNRMRMLAAKFVRGNNNYFVPPGSHRLVDRLVDDEDIYHNVTTFWDQKFNSRRLKPENRPAAPEMRAKFDKFITRLRSFSFEKHADNINVEVDFSKENALVEYPELPWAKSRVLETNGVHVNMFMCYAGATRPEDENNRSLLHITFQSEKRFNVIGNYPSHRNEKFNTNTFMRQYYIYYDRAMKEKLTFEIKFGGNEPIERKNSDDFVVVEEETASSATQPVAPEPVKCTTPEVAKPVQEPPMCIMPIPEVTKPNVTINANPVTTGRFKLVQKGDTFELVNFD